MAPEGSRPRAVLFGMGMPLPAALVRRRFGRIVPLSAVMAGGLATAILAMQPAGPSSLAAMTKVTRSVTQQNSPSNRISSKSFSTTQPNTLVVALLATDGPTSGGQRFTSVTGGGLTWHLATFSNRRLGDAEIWYAVAPTKIAKVTVRGTRAFGGYTGFLDVQTLAGVDPAQPIGSVGSQSGPSGGPNVSLTLARQGSSVLAVGNDWDRATNRTVAPRQTLLHQFLASSGDTFWSQSLTTDQAAGTAVSVFDTAPTDDQWNMAAVEVSPAASGGPIPDPTPTPTPTPTPSVTPPSGQTSFSDEFNGSSLDTSKWVALDRSGDSSNQEVGCYAPDHAGVSGGVLTLRTDVAACPDGRSYTSGAIQMRSFSFTYGTVEFRSKEAGGVGTWPAEWLLGANCQQTNVASADNTPPCAWPNPGSDEIDIAEIFSYDHTMVNEQIHSGSNQDRCLPHVSDVTQNWHTYQLVWAPGSLVWKIDGVTTCTKTAGIPSTPMFLIINTAVGGIGGGTVDASTLPQTHQVDYVRVSR